MTQVSVVKDGVSRVLHPVVWVNWTCPACGEPNRTLSDPQEELKGPGTQIESKCQACKQPVLLR